MRTLFLLVYISGAAAAPLSFFGVGDWGAPDPLLQDRVASSMAATADAMATPPAFVLALGDNFYEKGVASVDYDRWVEAPDDEAAPAAESVDYESAPGVTLLDAAALNAARKEHDLVVLDVFYPWCARARNSSARN